MIFKDFFLGRLLPASQLASVSLSTPSLFASCLRVSPKVFRVSTSLSQGLWVDGAYPKKAIIRGTKHGVGWERLASQLRMVLLTTPSRSARSCWRSPRSSRLFLRWFPSVFKAFGYEAGSGFGPVKVK